MIKKEEIIVGTKEELIEYFSQFGNSEIPSLPSVSEQLEKILKENSKNINVLSIVFYRHQDDSDKSHIIFDKKYVRIITSLELEIRKKEMEVFSKYTENKLI